MKLSADLYTADAIEASRANVIDWLVENDDGFPGTWDQASLNCKCVGFELRDRETCAPPIAGYERLEQQGLVEWLGDVERDGQMRTHFRITAAGRAAIV